MTTPDKVYEKYLVKVEKNGTNDNAATDRGKFCIIYNESANKFTEFNLQRRGEDDIRYIQHLLILDKKIPFTSKTYNHYNFPLPKKYFDLADVRAIASQKECAAPIDLFEIQTENSTQILSDEDNKPSFKWREAPYTINSDSISVYTDNNFSVDYIYLSYYRYPNQMTLVDINDPESVFASTPIEWDDKALDRIISICAGEFNMNEANPQFQVQEHRTQK